MNKRQSSTLITIIGLIVVGVVVYLILTQVLGMFREKAIADGISGGISNAMGTLGQLRGQ